MTEYGVEMSVLLDRTKINDWAVKDNNRLCTQDNLLSMNAYLDAFKYT